MADDRDGEAVAVSTARRRGRPPGTKRYAEQRAVLSVRLRNEVRERVAEKAAAAGRSLSEQIEHMLETALVSEAVATEVASLRDEVRALVTRLHPARP